MNTKTTRLADLPSDLSYFSLCQIQDIFRYADPRVAIKRLPDATVELDEFGNVWPLGSDGVNFRKIKDDAKREAIREACGANLPFALQAV